MWIPEVDPAPLAFLFFSFPGKKKRGQSFLERSAGPLCRIMGWRPWGAGVSDEEAGQGGDRHKWIDAGGGNGQPGNGQRQEPALEGNGAGLGGGGLRLEGPGL